MGVTDDIMLYYWREFNFYDSPNCKMKVLTNFSHCIRYIMRLTTKYVIIAYKQLDRHNIPGFFMQINKSRISLLS